jgi:NADH-quinone oxidoreductase subunit N
MISSQNLLLLYLGIELLSLSLYSVIAFNRNSLFSSEAAVKYYILGAISSGFLLFGISLVYGLTGSLNFNEIFTHIALLNISSGIDSVQIIGLLFALIFILISLSFKFGAAPFHMWIPDVYHGSIITTTLLLSTIPKIAVFVIFLKLLAIVFSGLFLFWSDMVIILSVLSILIGNIIAISQTNIKRMLAYSTIANIGFILLGLSVGSAIAYKAAMFYTLTYVITTIAAFGLLSQLIYKKKPVESISDLSGLNSSMPFAAFLLMVILLSYIGIPPFLGFHAKLFIIQSLVESNNIPLSIFAVLMTVIGSFYYLRVIKVIYFDELKDELLTTSKLYFTGVYVIGLVLLGLLPDILGQLSQYSISNLFNT